MLHCTTSGVADHFAENEPHALHIARLVAKSFNSTNNKSPPTLPSYQGPVFSPTELDEVIPADPKSLLDPRQVLARILDASEFDEFKARYGTTLVCGFGQIQGMRVGIIANHGVLFSESALKGVGCLFCV